MEHCLQLQAIGGSNYLEMMPAEIKNEIYSHEHRMNYAPVMQTIVRNCTLNCIDGSSKGIHDVAFSVDVVFAYRLNSHGNLMSCKFIDKYAPTGTICYDSFGRPEGSRCRVAAGYNHIESKGEYYSKRPSRSSHIRDEINEMLIGTKWSTSDHRKRWFTDYRFIDPEELARIAGLRWVDPLLKYPGFHKRLRRGLITFNY